MIGHYVTRAVLDGRLPNGWRRRTVTQPLTAAPMSPYELSSSVAYPVIGPYMDETVFCTWCIDYNRRAIFDEYHICVRALSGKMQEGNSVTAHPSDTKRASSLSGTMLLCDTHAGRFHDLVLL